MNLVRFEDTSKSSTLYTSNDKKTQTRSDNSSEYGDQNLRTGFGMHVSPAIRLAATYAPRSIKWHNALKRHTETDLVKNTSEYTESVYHFSDGDEEEFAIGAQIKPSSMLRVNSGVLRSVPHTEAKTFDGAKSPETHSSPGRTKASVGVEYLASRRFAPIGSIAMTSFPNGKMQEIAAGIDSSLRGITLGATGRYFKYDGSNDSESVFKFTRWSGVFSLGTSF